MGELANPTQVKRAERQRHAAASFESVREVLEETGLEIGPLRFLRVLNSIEYAPKHYVDLAFVAEWRAGVPAVLEPDKVERWDWYAVDDLPSPLFAMLPSAIAMLPAATIAQACQDSAWQQHVATYPREAFLTAFRDAHAVLHRLWTAAVGKEGYVKADWKALDNALARFARDAAEAVGIDRSEPLL